VCGVPAHPHPAARRRRRPVGRGLDAWLPLTYALNAISRSIGDEDLYPFVLAPAAIEKLALIDRLVWVGREA
jgi:hypothetical protein